jgi:outer membrane murein-binding lipoprotein Lpp
MNRLFLFSAVLLVFFVTGCTTIEKYTDKLGQAVDSFADKVERTVKKQERCESQTARYAQSYTTTSSYRCVGDGCQDYGCNQ